MFTFTNYREIYSIDKKKMIVYDQRNNVWVGECKTNCWYKLLQFFKGVKRADSLTGRKPVHANPFPSVGYNNIPLWEN